MPICSHLPLECFFAKGFDHGVHGLAYVGLNLGGKPIRVKVLSEYLAVRVGGIEEEKLWLTSEMNCRRGSFQTGIASCASLNDAIACSFSPLFIDMLPSRRCTRACLHHVNVAQVTRVHRIRTLTVVYTDLSSEELIKSSTEEIALWFCPHSNTMTV